MTAARRSRHAEARSLFDPPADRDLSAARGDDGEKTQGCCGERPEQDRVKFCKAVNTAAQRQQPLSDSHVGILLGGPADRPDTMSVRFPADGGNAGPPLKAGRQVARLQVCCGEG